jgi:hypothetical protein
MPDDKTLTVHVATTADATGIEKIDAALTDLSAKDAVRSAEQERAYQEFTAEKERLIAAETKAKADAAAKEKADFDAFSDRFDKEQQKRQAAAQKDLAAEAKSRDDAERTALAQETATAAKASHLHQKIAQLRDLASQATQAGTEIQDAFKAVDETGADNIETLEKVGKAGVDSAGNIAAAWAAGGPVVAVVTAIMQLKDGLIALFQDAESIQADLAEATAGRVEAAQARLDAVLAKASGTTQSDREAALKSKQDADKATADAAKQAEAEARRARESQDLDRRGISDPVARKSQEISDRSADEIAKARREQEAIQRQLENEKALREKLGEALTKSEAERQSLLRNAESLKAGLGTDDTDGTIRKRFDANTGKIAANQTEQERTQEEVIKSNSRSEALKRQAESSAANNTTERSLTNRRGGIELDETRASEAIKAQRLADAAYREIEAEARRTKAQRTAPGQRGILDNEDVEDASNAASSFARDKTGPSSRLGSGDARLNNLTKAAEALKDGATATELAALDAAIKGLSGTILTSKKADADRVRAIAAAVADLTKKLASTRE